MEKKGWFGSVEREIFKLDPFAGRGAETGTTSIERAVISATTPVSKCWKKRTPPGFQRCAQVCGQPQAGRVVSIIGDPRKMLYFKIMRF